MKYLKDSFQLQNRQSFMEGMYAGGQEAFEFVSSSKAPLGLSTHLLRKR